ncbi:winged helix-turn-helix transcriptional regulator [Streptomyces qinglanensis]|uniref:winged helix-turn-helix transcriptional regulator n=1 Tax=Streptomyces qinglanensis TaxID=943816 RepID=UPI00379E29AC
MTHRTVSCGPRPARPGLPDAPRADVPDAPRPGLPDDPRAEADTPAPSCPVEITLHALRGRWTTLVVRELLRRPHTYSQLAAALPGLSDKTLTERLRQLADAGVVLRDRSPGWPTTVRYRLTAQGRALGPVLQAMWEWGAAADPPEPAR